MIQTFIDDNNNLVTTYDIDGMLYENAIWLAHQIKLPTSEFIKIAEQITPRPQDLGASGMKLRY